MTQDIPPARTLRELRAQSRQLLPLDATDNRRVDLNAVRGKDIRRRFAEIFEERDLDGPAVPGGNDFVYIAYAGHRGSGKTTELNLVRKDLEEQGHFVIYKDAFPEDKSSFVDLSFGNLQYSDILLYMAHSVAEGVGKDWSDQEAALRPVTDWFAKVTKISKEEVLSEASLGFGGELSAGMPLVGRILAKALARIKGSRADAEEIRAETQRSPKELIDAVNELLNRASLAVGKRVVLVLDSLDKHPPKPITEAFAQNSRVFTELKLDLVVTVPLATIMKPEGESLRSCGYEVITLPTLSVRERTDRDWKSCREDVVGELVEIIAKRAEVGKLLSQEVARRMAQDSGGSLRDLLHLLLEAARAGARGGDSIDMAAYEEGRRSYTNDFTQHLFRNGLARLAKIHLEKDILGEAEDFDLLFNRFVLEYNGTRWFDVHPLIWHRDDFKELLKKQKTTADGPGDQQP